LRTQLALFAFFNTSSSFSCSARLLIPAQPRLCPSLLCLVIPEMSGAVVCASLGAPSEPAVATDATGCAEHQPRRQQQQQQQPNPRSASAADDASAPSRSATPQQPAPGSSAHDHTGVLSPVIPTLATPARPEKDLAFAHGVDLPLPPAAATASSPIVAGSPVMATSASLPELDRAATPVASGTRHAGSPGSRRPSERSQLSAFAPGNSSMDDSAGPDGSVVTRQLSEATLPMSRPARYGAGARPAAANWDAGSASAVGRTGDNVPAANGLPPALHPTVPVGSKSYADGSAAAESDGVVASVATRPNWVRAALGALLLVFVLIALAITVVAAIPRLWWLLLAFSPIAVAIAAKLLPLTTTRVDFLDPTTAAGYAVRVTLTHALAPCAPRRYLLPLATDLGRPQLSADGGTIFFHVSKRFAENASSSSSPSAAADAERPPTDSSASVGASASSHDADAAAIASGSVELGKSERKVTVVVFRKPASHSQLTTAEPDSPPSDPASDAVLQAYGNWRQFIAVLRSGASARTAVETCGRLAVQQPGRGTDDLADLDKALEVGEWQD